MLQYLFIYLKAQHLHNWLCFPGGREEGDAAAWAFDV